MLRRDFIAGLVALPVARSPVQQAFFYGIPGDRGPATAKITVKQWGEGDIYVDLGRGVSEGVTVVLERRSGEWVVVHTHIAEKWSGGSSSSIGVSP